MGDDHPPTVFDPSDPNIKNDLNMMVYQYLREQQLFTTADSIQNELGLKVSETAAKRYIIYYVFWIYDAPVFISYFCNFAML
jgi:hypothetical protein